ncbi:toxin-antitoxin system YwqK family antitoxin [Anatilimnocola floriformis]|uniref:toxin-antitoxin system YwqK family antitoxin n=1 Tax=Anatilimnocola floriformis TaxID=2948575 RepID=UPI0020C52F47|nr:hypothetical protein [Anatilimnocola floriformis]
MSELPLPRPRRFRLQFSLRMILLLMAAVGVGLTIYRWPWVERDFAYQSIGDDTGASTTTVFERRVTYHRDWLGKPVRHGLSQSLRNGEVWYEANYYDGQLCGPRRVWDLKGKLAIEATYLGDKLHGPFRSGYGGQCEYVGQYEAGEFAGEWRSQSRCNFGTLTPPDFDLYIEPTSAQPIRSLFSEFYPRDLDVLVTSNWRKGKRHGRTTWQTVNGELLNTAEYVNHEIVTWNGEPLVEQFWNWLHEQRDPQLAAWLSKATAGEWSFYRTVGDDKLLFRFPSNSSIKEPLLIHFENRAIDIALFDDQHLGLVPALCEYAVQEGCGFDYRYGSLWVVPRAADPTPPFVDPTGIDLVQFAHGSSQEQEWNEVIPVRSQESLAGDCFAHLLRGTSIEFDRSASDGESYFSFEGKLGDVLFRRRRRDIIGLILYRGGYRCVQFGDRIYLVRRWEDMPWTAPGPLSPPQNLHFGYRSEPRSWFGP